MSIVQLDYIPSYSSSSKVEPRVLITRFGDGYCQRAANGINLFPDKWSLTFQNITDVDALAIETILKNAAGGTVQWKPAPAAIADPYRNFMCLSWQRTRNNYNSQTLTCELEEVFN
jgi:phage-related protein